MNMSSLGEGPLERRIAVVRFQAVSDERDARIRHGASTSTSSSFAAASARASACTFVSATAIT